MICVSIAYSLLQVLPAGLPARPIIAPLRDGGTMQLVGGSWQHGAHAAALPGQIIYDNTCGPIAYLSVPPGTLVTDDGEVPSPTAPDPPGCRTSYAINGFQIA